MVIPGFETAVAAMEVGETKSVTIPSDDAYGERRDAMIGMVPRDSIPGNADIRRLVRSGTRPGPFLLIAFL